MLDLRRDEARAGTNPFQAPMTVPDCVARASFVPTAPAGEPQTFPAQPAGIHLETGWGFQVEPRLVSGEQPSGACLLSPGSSSEQDFRKSAVSQPAPKSVASS